MIRHILTILLFITIFSINIVANSNLFGGSLLIAPYVVAKEKSYESEIYLNNRDTDSMFLYKVSLTNKEVVTYNKKDNSVVNFYIFLPPNYYGSSIKFSEVNGKFKLRIDEKIKIYADNYYEEVAYQLDHFMGGFTNGYITLYPILEVDLNDDISNEPTEIGIVEKNSVNNLYLYLSDANYNFNDSVPNDTSTYGLLAGKKMRKVENNKIFGKLQITSFINGANAKSITPLQIYNNVISTDTIPSYIRLDGFSSYNEHFLGYDYQSTFYSQITNNDISFRFDNSGKDQALILSFIGNSNYENAKRKAITFSVYDSNNVLCTPTTNVETTKTQNIMSVDTLLTDIGCVVSSGRVVVNSIYTSDTLHYPTIGSFLKFDLNSTLKSLNLEYLNYTPNSYIYDKPDISKIISNLSNGWHLIGTSFPIYEDLKNVYNLDSVWIYNTDGTWGLDPSSIKENSGFWINKNW